MRNNLYMSAILICACLMLLAGLAFAGLEILQYTKEPELSAPPAKQETTPVPETPESGDTAAPSETPGPGGE